MGEQKAMPIIGGPMDGLWWDMRAGLQVCALRPKMQTITKYDKPDSFDRVLIKDVRYKIMDVIHYPKGEYVSVLVPSYWTLEQTCRRLEEVAPNGEF